MASFSTDEKSVIRVYYRCLVLGFKGRYYSPDDVTHLNTIKQDCLELMAVGGSKQFFPDLYACLDKKPIDITVKKVSKWYQRKLIWWLIPVVLLILVFMFFYGILHFTVKNYIATLM